MGLTSQPPPFWPPATLTGLDQGRRCVRRGRGPRRFGPGRGVVGTDSSRGIIDRSRTSLGRGQQCPPSLGTISRDIRNRGCLGQRILASPRTRTVPVRSVRRAGMGITEEPHQLRRVVRGNRRGVRVSACDARPQAQPGERSDVRDRYIAESKRGLGVELRRKLPPE